MKKAKDVIRAYSPCGSAMEWLSERTIQEMVDECHRGDWLLWLGKRAGVDIRKLTLAKALCAKQVEHLMKDQRSKDALDAAIRFGNGQIEQGELAAAAYAAYAAADDADDAAAYAAAAAAYAAAYAAYAAADADDARKNSLKKSSDICREVFGTDLIAILSSL